MRRERGLGGLVGGGAGRVWVDRGGGGEIVRHGKGVRVG